jgi:hypothetical protein
MKKEKPIRELFFWWEDELTPEQRNELIGDYMWNGTSEERHQKLREFYKQYVEKNKN